MEDHVFGGCRRTAQEALVKEHLQVELEMNTYMQTAVWITEEGGKQVEAAI